jgi:adenine-specific DNA-methyltransferase
MAKARKKRRRRSANNPPATGKKLVEALTHDQETRMNIPTAECQPLLPEEDTPLRAAYARRNRDLDPQLVWRGKDQKDLSDLVTLAPPLFIQEKVHPKVLIDDLVRRTAQDSTPEPATSPASQADLFDDFSDLPKDGTRTEFYQHHSNWTNRLILGDSLQVMASLAEREGLRNSVQCIYLDPPYGIKFNSNFQWSTTSNKVTDGKAEHITREPEQVKAFRDTWRDGIHSYLSYLRDRLTVARELLSQTGSIFVQIGDENVHRVRALLDEVFGDSNFIAQIIFKTTSNLGGAHFGGSGDYLLWFAKDRRSVKYRQLFTKSGLEQDVGNRYTRVQTERLERRRMNPAERRHEATALADVRVYRHDNLKSQSGGRTTSFDYEYEGILFRKGKKGYWKTNVVGMDRLARAWRLGYPTERSLAYVRFIDDFPVTPLSDLWTDTQTGAFTADKVYVVQTNTKVVERCLLMATDPGDLILDPTCGSGTAAHIAEKWGRRWITIDTSRVALALTRARLMGARYPYYLLADSKAGRAMEAEVTGKEFAESPTSGDIRLGFVYHRVPHITLRSITNNASVDVIWESYQEQMSPLLATLNRLLEEEWSDWDVPVDPEGAWSSEARTAHKNWQDLRRSRQDEIDAAIAMGADCEFLVNDPYEEPSVVRVAGPFTVESISPHRTLGVSENDDLLDPALNSAGIRSAQNFTDMVLETLKASGVQQAHRDGKIQFSAVSPWPGTLICAEGSYSEEAGESLTERRAAVFVGPEFGTVSRPDLVAAAREASDGGFDVLVACAFNFEALVTDFKKLGRIPVLKARMNADLHMAGELKNTGKGNLFVIFGEPDIDVIKRQDGKIQVKINGVDVFHPSTGEVRSDGPEGIACWFVDTQYNEESFFVRHAYFLGASDPYKSLRATLKAEINEDAWESLHSDISRPFSKPKSGRIAVKVINHLGDEVMKVFRVE